MMNDFLLIGLSLVISITAGIIYIPGIVIISKKKNLYDTAGGRKPHKGNIPRTAGLAFFPTFILSFFVPLTLMCIISKSDAVRLLESSAAIQTGMLLAGLSLLFMMGFVDDLIGVSWRRKFLIQFLAGLMPVLAGMGITDLDGLFGLHQINGWAGSILTILAVMLIVNAYNLIDGIDGLCSSLSVLATTVLGGWFLTHGYTLYALTCASIIGITIVYFYYNTTFGRFRTFMGDTGSTNLGFIIAFLALAFYNCQIEADSVNEHPLAILMGLVSLPLLDTARVFAVRIYKGLSPFHPDKRHLHHKLLELGLKHLHCTLICIALQGCSFGINYLMRDVNINIVIAVNIAFMLLYTLSIDGMVRMRVATRQIEKKQDNVN